jgi:hypothetical protein
MSLEYKILGQELVSYTDVPGEPGSSYYVSYEETAIPMYLAIASRAAAYSTDRINWTNVTLPLSPNSTTYGNGKFLAVGFTENAYSSDLITWTIAQRPLSEPWLSVAYGNGKFVASPIYNVVADSAVFHSEDGISWEQSNLPSVNSWGKVVFAKDRFFVTNDGYGGNTAYSTDGVTWTEIPKALQNISYGNDKFISASSFPPTSSYSTDGINWTDTAIPDAAPWNYTVFGNGIFLLGATGSNSFYYSPDGINWSLGDYPGSFYNRSSSLSFAEGKFLMIAEGKTSYLSADAITWTQSQMPDHGSLPYTNLAIGQTTQLVETLNIIGGQGTSQTEELLPITVYTVPVGKQTTVTSIFVANHDDTDSTYDLAVVPAGEELSLKHHIRWDMAVAANDFENISTKITMSAGDKLVIFPSTVDTVSITAFGVEK